MSRERVRRWETGDALVPALYHAPVADLLAVTELALGLPATYAVAVVLLQVLLAPVTRTSDLAVARSILAVAALVQPLRRRMLATFSACPREQANLYTLAGKLVAAVQDAMHPDQVTLWVRPARRDGVMR